MQESKKFLKLRSFQDIDFGAKVKSKSNPGKTHWVYKKEGNWYCDCVAGLMKKECRHIKKVMKMINEDSKCFSCGTSAYAAGGLDRNHVLLRGTNPELIKDDDNICLLCRKCHNRFHNEIEFRTNIQTIWRRRKLILKQQSTT